MKKTIATVLLIFALFVFTSCGEHGDGQKQLQTNIPFTCTVNFDYDSLSAQGKLTYRNAASCTFELLSPSAVEGVIFEFDGEQITAQYKGISFAILDTNAQAVTAAKLIFSSLAGAETEKNTQDDGNEFLIRGETDSVNYELRFDKISGYVKSLSAKSLNFSAEFKDFKFLE